MSFLGSYVDSPGKPWQIFQFESCPGGISPLISCPNALGGIEKWLKILKETLANNYLVLEMANNSV